MTNILEILKKYKFIFIIFIVILLIVLPDKYLPEIIRGIFILFGIMLTALFSMHQYQSEQRTSRLQKIYIICQ